MATTTPAAEDLTALRADVRRFVSVLTKPTITPILREDGTVDRAVQPGLLDQLADAVASNRGGTVPGRGGAPMPISAEALDLHRELADAFGVRPDDLNDHLAQVPDQAKQVRDPLLLGDVIDGLAWAIRSIEVFLHPPRTLHAVAECPACGVATVHRPDSAGEIVRQPALAIDTSGCTCQACRAYWPPEHLEHLALTLGCQPLPA